MCLCGAAAACLWSRLTSGVARAKTCQGVERLNITHTAILQLRVHPLDELISSSTHFYCSLQYTQSPSSYLVFVSVAYLISIINFLAHQFLISTNMFLTVIQCYTTWCYFYICTSSIMANVTFFFPTLLLISSMLYISLLGKRSLLHVQMDLTFL